MGWGICKKDQDNQIVGVNARGARAVSAHGSARREKRHSLFGGCSWPGAGPGGGRDDVDEYGRRKTVTLLRPRQWIRLSGYGLGRAALSVTSEVALCPCGGIWLSSQPAPARASGHQRQVQHEGNFSGPRNSANNDLRGGAMPPTRLVRAHGGPAGSVRALHTPAPAEGRIGAGHT